MNWNKYSFQDKESHPPKSGRYLIYREKCDKMHFEHWNGKGWSSSNNDCTHWVNVTKPSKSVFSKPFDYIEAYSRVMEEIRKA